MIQIQHPDALQLIETELRFISRHSQNIECSNSRDHEAVDEIALAVNSALRALHELRLELQPANEEIPSDVRLAA